MSNLTVEIKGMKELQAAFKKSPEIVSLELDRAIKKVIIDLQGSSKPFTPIDKGDLRSRDDIILSNLFGKFEKTAPHAIYVHEGTSKWPLSIPPKNPNTVRQFLDKTIKVRQKITDKTFDDALTNITDKLAK